jgi:hypothetical protein
MHDLYQKIGVTAGKVHKALEKSGGSNLDALAKEIGVTDAALFNQSIGWLCREGKLSFEMRGQALRATLAVSESACCK